MMSYAGSRRPPVGATWALALALVLPAWALGAPLESAPSPVTLRTGDGLSLVLDAATGSATRLRVGGAECLREPGPLVYLETVDARRPGGNLIGDGGFERGAQGWALEAGAAVDGAAAHSGQAALRVDDHSSAAPVFAARMVTVNQTRVEPLLLRGWSRAALEADVTRGVVNTEMALVVTLTYQDGQRESRCQSAYLPPYDHGWTRAEAVICPDKPVREVELRVGLGHYVRGTLWLDDLELRPVRFVTAAVRGPLRREGGQWRQRALLPGLGTQATVTYRAEGRSLRVSGEVAGPRGDDLAVTARVALPVAANGGTWWRHARASEVIADRGVRWDGFWYGAGRTGFHGMYPWSALDLPNGASLSLAVALDQPQIFRLLHNGWSGDYAAEFDLGLCGDPPGSRRARFSALLYRTEREWSFRDATERYHRLYPRAYLEKRVTREGLWMAFNAIGQVPGWQELGLQFNESAQDFAWEDRQGLTTLMYLEPGSSHQYPSVGDPRTPAAARERVAAVAAGKRGVPGPWHPQDPWNRDTASAVLASHLEDAWGNPTVIQFAGEDSFLLNAAPGVPALPGGAANEATVDLRCVSEGLGLKGGYHLDGWSANAIDYQRSFRVDRRMAHAGRQSVLLTTEPHYAHHSPWSRGLRQHGTLEQLWEGPITVEFWARGEGVPEGALQGYLELRWDDGHAQGCAARAGLLDGQWRRFEATITPDRPFRHFRFGLGLGAYTGRAWVDDVRVGSAGGSNLLHNGDFESGGWVAGRLQGVYLDTLECTQAFLNYRREHFAHLRTGLSFDGARRVVQPHLFGAWEFTRELGARLHRDDKLLMANACPLWSPFLVPQVDIAGQEEDWVPGGTGWAPKPDASLNWVRAMCRAKPYCLLLGQPGSAQTVRRILERCLFYGVFPSFACLPGDSPEGRLEPYYYWNRDLVGRDRPAFVEVVPIIRELSAAGWEPVTYARSDNPQVWVERYGPGGQQGCHLALFNPTFDPQQTRIRVERGALRLGRELRVREHRGRFPSLTLAPGEDEFEVTVPPEMTLAAAITRD